MPSIPELDSPFPTPFLVPSRRQAPNQNGPPPNADPDRATTTTSVADYTASLVSVDTTATYSAVNTYSLVIDSSAGSDVNAKSVAPTATTTGSIVDKPTSQSTAEKLFTPHGGLFAVGLVIIGLAVLTLLTCAIVTIRCTLRSRRRSRTLSRAQTFTEKNTARRKISSDRASEFWSAGANGPTRARTQSRENAVPESDLLNDGQRPARPARSGETEADLRAPGRVHFTPSVMMSDYTGLSMDVQLHGSARNSGANVDTDMANPLSTNSALAPPRAAVAEPMDRHMSTGTKFTSYTLDQDPFAASPMAPLPTTANPLLSSSHAMTFPPYAPNSPHTAGDSYVVSSPQFATNFSSSPSNIATVGTSPSDTLGLGSSVGSSNILGLTSSPLNAPYVPADTVVPLGTPTSGVMYKSGVDSVMSDPFAYDAMVRSRASTLGGTSHMASFPSPGVTWSNGSLGIASPAALHIEKTSPGIQTNPLPSPYLSSPGPLSSSYVTAPARTFQTPTQDSFLSLTPPEAPLLSPGLQSDVSQALNHLRRRLSDSTMATRHSQQTEYQYQPTLGAISDNDERNSGFFMGSSPGNSRRSLPFVPRLKVSASPEPETLQMQPTKTKSGMLQDGSPMYSSPVSVFDDYHQSSGHNSRSGSGPGTQAGSSSVGHGLAFGTGYSTGGSGSQGVDVSPALSDSVRTSVLSYFEKRSNV